MKLNLDKLVAVITVAVVSAAAIAATLMQLDSPVMASIANAANNAFKAKMAWIAYKSDAGQPQYDIRTQILVYADGPPGAQDIYIARSNDSGASWSEQAITSSGGNALTIGSTTFSITHNKPNIFVPPTGVQSPVDPADLTRGLKGANALITYTSSDCEASSAQKINPNLLTGVQPFMCLWAARSLDGGLTWSRQRLTDGSIDPDEDVPAGYTKSDLTAGGFAISFQADPAGLQQGDAEGPGDGASGAKVSAGTNIWYTFISKANFEKNAAFPAPVQVSDNNTVTDGAAGASRANLSISGGTAVLAYEETKGDGTNGKHIMYHSFPYTAPDTNNAGTVVSDPTKNARRVRFALQGDEAIGDVEPGTTPNKPDGDAADGDTAGVHVLLLWRETASLEPAAASDIMLRRGIKNTALRPGSSGFLASDVMADTPVNMSDTGATDNALAHRAMLRGDFVALAYDHTPEKSAADAFTGTYNLFIRRSTDGGSTWGLARNMTQLADASTRVVEPRMVSTPATIKLPDGSATTEAMDTHNKNVFYVGWGTETNEVVGKPLDLFIIRTTDQGLNYERVQLLAGGATEQSEMQLRSTPDGKSVGALWMQRDATTGTVDVIYRHGGEVTNLPDPDLKLTGSDTSFTSGSKGQVTFTVLNKGAGDARRVVISGSAPSGLTILALSEPALCSINGAQFTCTIPELSPSQSRVISLTLASAIAGTYDLATQVSGDVLDADATDNTATTTVAVLPVAASGGGCAAANGRMPFDPLLPVLAVLGFFGWGVGRWRRSPESN